ncbi:SDR family NAD(P)-dependent oxidoreductase [Planosporangium flavigriseum]|uniref:Short-chain dehydrogenase/reductase SDR n=1 Tax=Planosporangium flavigriseum TaxID=373681 RepID=A0A8J3PM04_9ACTN|nr:SDR family NAD(P)-dependent oxidoreductase [Planosporangium flavigriseum]NJC65263.1 SDR family NAD(P)-dependent oxidoreductase [Planosporangium flavigriseum]GIG73383.1 short-chain dehydrogenase/reductase SDR [Planosporangium flavigriseum]
MTSLAGKVAFVTGASSGIGAAVARALAAEGVKVGFTSRKPVDLGLADGLGVACDVRDLAQVEAAVAATVDRFGGLDIVVANAGVGSWGPFEDTPVEDLDEMVDVNVRGLFHTVRATLPHLKARGAGDIITVASEAGRRGLPDEAAYVATKFASVGFTRSLDHELRGLGIRCTNICPGGVATNFGMGRGLRTPDMPQLADMMSSEDVAEMVLFALTRPRHYRMLEVAFRSMSEQSWG